MSKMNEEKMSPEASPGTPSKSGVRRVNNLPLYIVAGGLAIFLLIMVLVASDRASKQNQSRQRKLETRNYNTVMFAKEIAGEQRDGIILAKSVPPTAPPAVPVLDPSFGSVEIARPPNLDMPPTPPTSQQHAVPLPRTPRDDEEDRVRMLKLQQFDEAVRARTSISTGNRGASAFQGAQRQNLPGSPGNHDEVAARLASVRNQLETATRDDPTAAYKARLEQLRRAGFPGGADPAKSHASRAQGKDLAAFEGTGQGDRWRLESQPEAPSTPFELRAGFVIPATLISGVNSELPGQIVAQVSQDVFDTPIGRYKLIPQGARLVGSYASDIAYGQKRILVAWQRIVFPDGKAMDIGAMPGADSAGYAGFKDQVNSHYFRLFSSAVLMSAVTAGIAMSQPESRDTHARPTAGSAMSEALGQQLGQVTAQLISKNLNVAPTLEVRPGYRFNVIVTKDMSFSKPYTAFDY